VLGTAAPASSAASVRNQGIGRSSPLAALLATRAFHGEGGDDQPNLGLASGVTILAGKMLRPRKHRLLIHDRRLTP
jgi:hypothetical protein